MDKNEIKVSMKVVCKESHYNDGLYWAIPEMDEAIGKPMTVIMVDEYGLVFCEFETTLKDDDGRWCFLPEWLEPWMEISEAIKLVNDRMCWGRGNWSEHHAPKKDMYWLAGEMAIEALKRIPAGSALDHIHNVVAENEYKRGYEQGKADTKVEAIPVEWIEKKMQWLGEHNGAFYDPAYFLETMLAEWKEEQQDDSD